MSSIKSRDSASNAIKRYMQASSKEAESADRESIECSLKLLEEQWIRFNQAQDAVENSCSDATRSAEDDARIQAETWYTTALANFQRQLRRKYSNADTGTRAPISSSIRLPKMDLPTFSGDPTEWISFHDAFQSLINSNASLSDGQKLHYLRSCLKGEALLVISSFKISDANYSEAWDLIQARYKVVRMIIEKHFRAIFAIEQAHEDSSVAIKHVLDTILQHVRALSALGRPVQFWDDWLVHVVVSKIAFETRKQWELSLSDGDLPTFEELQIFLEKRCRSLAMVASAARPLSYNKSSPKNKQKNASVLHTIQNCEPSVRRATRNCLYCRKDHNIYSCIEYDHLDINSKISFIKENACMNCLSTGHYLAKCRSSSTCRVCQKRHHSSIHTAFANNARTTAHNFASTASTAGNVNIAPTAANLMRSTSTAEPHSGTTAAALLSSAITDISSSRESLLCIDEPVNKAVMSHHTSSRNILLATALIRVRDAAGRWQSARVLFDNGSHASFMTESCMQRLGLRRRAARVIINGIGSAEGGRSRGEGTLTLAPLTSNRTFQIDALILQKNNK